MQSGYMSTGRKRSVGEDLRVSLGPRIEGREFANSDFWSDPWNSSSASLTTEKEIFSVISRPPMPSLIPLWLALLAQ